MQGACHLSRRWHQQFCHSPSFASHKRCLQALIPIRQYRLDRRTRLPRNVAQDPAAALSKAPKARDTHPLAPSNLLSRENDDLVVREFEQHGSDSSTRRPFDPAKPLREETEAIWQEIQQVEEELRVVRQGPLGPESPFMKQLPAEEREQVLKVLADETEAFNEEDTLDLAELDRIMEEAGEEGDPQDQEEMQVTLRIPKAQQAYVAKFNKALVDAQNNKEDMLKILNIWKWYLRCQQKVPGFSSIVPEPVWGFLWQSQKQLGVRQRHLVMLGKDMLAAEGSMTPEQTVEYIEALHACGEISTALACWEEMKPQLAYDARPDFISNFYKIGIQLYAAVGRPQKAQRVAYAALDDGAPADILVQVITGWAQSRAPGAGNKLWAVYLKMRLLLGENMTPELYEKISDALIDQKRSEMALAVFKDLIERIKGSGGNTLEAYEEALGSISTKGTSEDVEQAINQVSLGLLLALPPKYHNKFFFASWIKKLLGQGRIDAAAMVVDLMYERNIKPDAIHLNGIIGAWLREKNPQSREKAVQLAHDMVLARVAQVTALEHNNVGATFGNLFRKTVPHLKNNERSLKDVRLNRPVPAANHETFVLLLDHLSEARQWSEFEELARMMSGAAQLRSNALIANRILAASLESKSMNKFWRMFRDLTHERPNIESFALAWQALSLRGGHNPSEGEAGPTPQGLFAAMTDWHQTLSGPGLRKARHDFHNVVYSTITRAMCYQRDLPGLVCTLQGLYSMFGATPDDVSVQLITGLVARLLPRATPEKPRLGARRRANSPFHLDQTMLKSIADIIETFEIKRKIELVENKHATAEEVEDPDSTVVRKIRLDVMTEFLVAMLKKIEEPGTDVEQKLRDVSLVMHVNISHLDIDAMLVES